MRISRRTLIGSSLALAISPGRAAKASESGISKGEIKLGQTNAYSGPLSGVGSTRRVQGLYFEKLNAEGGINGRKLTLISLDDAYTPPKTVEATRRLVESDEVFATFNSFGTPTQAAVQRYLNSKKVPQLFVSSGSSRFNDSSVYPWSTPALPDIQRIGAKYGAFVARKFNGAKVSVLYQNDDFGKDMLAGVREGLGPNNRSMLVKDISYEVTEPTIFSQVANLKASGADVLINLSTGRAAVQSIKRIKEIGWKPIHIINGAFGTIYETFQPVGLEDCAGIYSSAFAKDPADPQWENDPEMKAYFEFMKRHAPDVAAQNRTSLTSYVLAQVMVYVLQRLGENLTRSGVVKLATNLDSPNITALTMPGVVIKTSNESRNLFSDEVMTQFNGQSWELVD